MSGNNENKELYEYLVAEFKHHFDYWDWSYLNGRRVILQTEKPWDYLQRVRTAMGSVHSVLDMHTGSGEVFLEALQQQPVVEVYATEGYAPNLARAREVLEPVGATVFEIKDDCLPFADNSLALIINRHGSYDLREVWRVLKPDHLFMTQQVGSQSNARIHELLGVANTAQQDVWNLDVMVCELVREGWQVVEQASHVETTRFYDTGALVYYLKAIPWCVSDFSVEKYFERLVEIHQLIERDGYLDVPFHTFFVMARKG